MELRSLGLDTAFFSHYLYRLLQIILTHQASLSFSKVQVVKATFWYHWEDVTSYKK